MKMADTSLSEIVARLSSDRQKDRADALSDLRRILATKRQSLNETLNDKAYHRIFEGLFRCAAIEKSVYSRSARSSSRSLSTPRLASCASAFRATLEVSVSVLRTKTVHAIIDHIVQTLTDPVDSLWDFLGNDYIKGLKILLSYPAHVEHLAENDWLDAIQFCLSCFKSIDTDGIQLSIRSSNRSLTDSFADTERNRGTPNRITLGQNATISNSQVHRTMCDEAVICIRFLTAIPAAPLHSVAGQLLRELLIYISSPTPVNASQGLKAINNITEKIICDQSALFKEYLPDLVCVLRRLWVTRSLATKEECLVTLLLCMDLLRHKSQTMFPHASLQSLEDLLETLEYEYIKRQEKEQLQIDDLIFYPNDSTCKHPYPFGPRIGNSRSEHVWTLLWTISSLMAILDRTLDHGQISAGDELISNKRPRLSSHIHDITRDCVVSTGPRKSYCLQLLIFLGREMSSDDKASTLNRLTASIVDDDASISNWTLLAISSIATSGSMKSPLLKPQWKQIWNLAFRACTFQANTRAACALMDIIMRLALVESSDILDSLRPMLFGMDLHGPSAMCDTSIRFMKTVVDHKLHITAGSGTDFVKGICNWLKNSWTFGVGMDKSQMAQVALSVPPADVLALLLSLCNKSAAMSHAEYQGITATISSVWFRLYDKKALKDFLFSLDDEPISHDLWTANEFSLTVKSSIRSDVNDEFVVEFLQSMVEAFSKAWKPTSKERSQYVTADIFRIMGTACIVVALYVEALPQPPKSRIAELKKSNLNLWVNICEYMIPHNDLVQALLSVLSPIVACAPYVPNMKDPISRALLDLSAPLITISRSHSSTQNDSMVDDPDTMDFQGLPSSSTHETVRDIILQSNRCYVKSVPESNTFQRCILIRLSIFADSRNDGSDSTNKTFFLENLKALDDVDILSSRNFLLNLFREPAKYSRAEILEILEHFGEVCLQQYQLERCESAQCFSISMMECFVEALTDKEDDDLTISASDLYGWFIHLFITKKKGSSAVLIALSRLLERIISLDPNLHLDGTGPSPRTYLFNILRDGDIVVKFAIASSVSNIFSRFLLKDHEKIFDDVVESLPTDPDWNEGIALRLYVLSKMASKWPTLLRRSIYHIFETPAQVPESIPYAEKCLSQVSLSLGLRGPKDVFRLFMPQILYTWTETQSISAMPYSIFRYSSLKEMLQDAQDELAGQIMMRASDHDADELAKYIGKPFKVVLQESFYKAEAYTVARDISLPPSQDSQPKGVESRVKRTLGSDLFGQLIDTKFPEVVSMLFKSLSQEEQIERAFSKRPNFSYCSKILGQITEKGVSTVVLPSSQQPSFRSRYLLDELEYLCKRAGYDLETMWTPALVSYVSRSLLDSMEPALGSLHACTVLRKLRILICISGPLVLEDYPLEQLLNALRPYLVDFHCSEDALGLFWYLLEGGKSYLSLQPGFLAGIAVSTFVSLRDFIKSSPESTTQESQFHAVINKIQEFRGWFADFLESYQPQNMDGEAEESFRRMVTSATHISNAGNAEKGTYESELLLELLRDRKSSISLLGKSVSDVVLSLLCVDFKNPGDISNDILGDEEACLLHNVAVWQSIQNGISDKGYRLWSARVLGRAFAATGQVSDELLREHNVKTISPQLQIQMNTAFFESKIAILQILIESLSDSGRANIGLVEQTLQLVVNNLTRFPLFEQLESIIPRPLLKSLDWNQYHCPSIRDISEINFNDGVWPTLDHDTPISSTEWARNLAFALANSAPDDPVIGPLKSVIYVIPDLSVRLLPFILHDVLVQEVDTGTGCRDIVSRIFNEALRMTSAATIAHAQITIDAILYLRQQEMPQESTIVDRDGWLDIDYNAAADAAVKCRMYKTALLFIEVQTSRSINNNRRASSTFVPPSELLHEIYRNVGDPDMFYGIEQEATLDSVLEKLDYESATFKNLVFQSAHYDSNLRLESKGSTHGLFKALNATNLHGVANAVLAVSQNADGESIDTDHLLSTAISLQRWDIPAPPAQDSTMAVLFKAFQNLNTVNTITEVLNFNETCLLDIMNDFQDQSRSVTALRDSMRALGLMTEVDDVLRSTSQAQIEEIWNQISLRKSWFQAESFQDISHILFCRNTLFSTINRKPFLKTALKLTSRASQLLEIKTIRESFKTSRDLEGSQEALTSAMLLSKLVQPCSELGLRIENAAKYDMASVLWDQGEMTTSIRMLQNLNEQSDLQTQSLVVSQAEVLASLGHHVAEARLEKPDAIINEYLIPAVKELRGHVEGEEAGAVFHRFALFCDQQLLNQDSLEDFQRIEQLRDRKEQEVLALKQMMTAAEGKEKTQLKMHYSKAKGWFDLDDREYQRLCRSREAFLQQCLENYLLSLKACDNYKNDVLRFCALWLDKSDDSNANKSVEKYLNKVPSRKFAPLINQLSSRLLDDQDSFQNLLAGLVFRVCVDHPFHGMYQIFAHSKTRGNRDQTALSRFQAATKIVDKLLNDKHAGTTWMLLHNNNIVYVRFATEKLDDKVRSGAKIPLRKSPTGLRLEQDVSNQRLPPPSMRIELRVDCDYSNVPRVVKFQPEFTVASGISAPKIVTVVATDGKRYKQLVKGGNDDLRQDAIMEQVFEQVSNVLRDHRSTRQRNLHIRTYKVLPLTSNAGIIEFVQNTIPLHDYLMPAHQRYFPKDMKPSVCRKHISDAQSRTLEHRVRTYRQVTDHFHPVMRFFFMEKFNNPDDWFSKRSAYTRSTAAISILGHVLGLGDRHGHNILLDEKTGEVVHIDLGVAFEQGRVLPVPEVVPFRLTRDLIDGMGITKTEGIFRRCCEFTLEALRRESYSIMTILDVLRYDPLYMWTVSPLRMRRMQDAQDAGDGEDASSSSNVLSKDGGADRARTRNKDPKEPSEADRALTVVAKKLSKALSVTATVNELIQQATDERNLAVLYCGWAAYA